jgi:hypothetical protein
MVSLPMWWSANPSKLAKAMLASILDLQGESRLYEVNLDDLAAVAREVPESLNDMVSQVKVQVNRKFDVAARLAWAKFVTTYGFSTPPSPRPAPPGTNGGRVRVVHPVVAVDLGKAVAVVACGQQTVTRCMEVMPVVNRLRVGSEHTVESLQEAFVVRR